MKIPMDTETKYRGFNRLTHFKKYDIIPNSLIKRRHIVELHANGSRHN